MTNVIPTIVRSLSDSVVNQSSRLRVRRYTAIALFAVLVGLSCLALPGEYRTTKPDVSSLRDALRLTGTLDRDSLQQLLPPNVILPDNAISARTTINCEVNTWFSSKLTQLLTKLSRTLPARGGALPADTRVTAALADGSGRIRVMYSNAAETYFETKRIPLASTAKIFVAIGLGEHDTAQTRYCVPGRITSWITADAGRSSLCPPGGHSVSASTAFARSMPAPLLWRARQILTERTLREIFLRLGIIPDGYASLREAAILGQVAASPRDMHRAVHAVTLALTGNDGAAQTPTVIDTIETHNAVDGRLDGIPIAMPAIPAEIYRSAITPTVIGYLRQVLNAPIRRGTLHALSSLKLSDLGISLLWGKTGTYAAQGKTRTMWIVGGLEVRDRPYSWVVLINAGDERHTFGNVNAAAFAPVAKLLIEAAVRDRHAANPIPAEIPHAADEPG